MERRIKSYCEDLFQEDLLEELRSFFCLSQFLEEVLCQMPELKVLYLKGNPFVTAIRNYRKTVIAKIPQLSYLDDRPVFKDDRRCAEAFLRGGLEAEREERKLMKEEERDAHRKQMESFRRMCDEAKRAGRERRDMRKGGTSVWEVGRRSSEEQATSWGVGILYGEWDEQSWRSTGRGRGGRQLACRRVPHWLVVMW